MLAAQGLLSTLERLAPERAQEVAQQWPAPSPDLGKSAETAKNQLEHNFQTQHLERVINEDPERALLLLAEQRGPSTPDYGLHSQLAPQLVRSGRKSEALKIVDEVIADFGQRGADAGSVHGYANFVQQVSMVDPGRFLEAFASLAQIANKPGQQAGSPARVRIGDETLELTTAESALLNVFRGM